MIATQLRTQAETAFVNGKVDEAAMLVGQGLQVRPQDVALLALKTRIEQARKGASAPPPQTSTTPAGTSSATTQQPVASTNAAPSPAPEASPVRQRDDCCVDSHKKQNPSPPQTRAASCC